MGPVDIEGEVVMKSDTTILYTCEVEPARGKTSSNIVGAWDRSKSHGQACVVTRPMHNGQPECSKFGCICQ